MRDNPWGITPTGAEVLDAVIKTGSQKGSARELGKTRKAIDSHTSKARMLMGLRRDNVRYLIAWDRWRQSQAKETAQ